MLRHILLIAGMGWLAAMAWGQSAPSTAPATVPAAVIAPVPAVALQATSQEMIHKLFAKAFAKTAPADRQALARLLLAQARDTKDDDAARYVALLDAAELAAGAGDAATAVAAIDEQARDFAVDRLELRRAALLKTSGAVAGEADFAALVRLALETADLAAEADAFDAVTQMVNLAEGSANKSRQLNLVASIQVRLADLRALTAEFAQVKAAWAQLERVPEDAQAHLTIGRFYALHKGQWARGLPHLAQCGDAELVGLSGRELALPVEGLAQAALADGWWEYGAKSTGVTRTHVTAHATEHYKAALQSLKGITLLRIQSRIEQGEKPSGTASAAGAVALMPLIDVARDAAQGQWVRGTEGITCASSAYACLQIPYVPAEEYDLTVSFTREADDGSIAVLLAAQKRAFGFVLDIKGEARFEQVAGKVAKDNPTVTPVAVSNGRRYTLTIEVRGDHVSAVLDGKTLCTYKTDLKDLTRYSVWKLGDNTLCGIGANGAKVTFHSIEMVDVKGKGKATR